MMAELHDDQGHLQQLRNEAENKVNKRLQYLDQLPKEQLEHELRVHQIELEMQNQELRETEVRLHSALDSYTSLYHQSPVGYVTIDQRGIIHDLNQSFAEMCQQPGERMLKRHLTDYLSDESQQVFRQRLPAFFKKPEGKKLELRLKVAVSPPLYVEIVGRHIRTRTEKYLACNLIDISRRTEAERIQQQLNDELIEKYQTIKEKQLQLEMINRTLEDRIVEATSGLVAANKRIRVLSAKMEKIRENERKALAQTLHDGIGQILVGIKFEIQKLKSTLTRYEDQCTLSLVEQDIVAIINKVRDLTTELRPSILDNLGLNEALKWKIADFARRTDMTCTIAESCHQLDKLSPDQQIALYRISEEALTNVLKHAAARRVEIDCRTSPCGNLIFSITDDGCGITDHSQSENSLGMISMNERAEYIGGKMKLTSAPEEGTTISIHLIEEKEGEDD